MITAKKHFGQHFLRDENIAQQIVDALYPQGRYKQVLEVGPGNHVETVFIPDGERGTLEPGRLADFAVLGWAWRHERHKVDLAQFPNVKRWYEQMMARPGVKRGFAVALRT